jgi:hypothetical protein
MVTKTTPPDPLDQLAGEIEARHDVPQITAEQERIDAEAAAQAEKLINGVRTFTEKALKALRQRLARKLPELREHWTDADLAAFAEAVPPVVQKRLAMLAPLMESYPEEGMLVLSAVPLVVGYVTALSDHDEKPRQQAAAPAGAPHLVAVPLEPSRE